MHRTATNRNEPQQTATTKPTTISDWRHFSFAAQMCKQGVCRDCVYKYMEREVGEDCVTQICATFEDWRNSCPDDMFEIGSKIPEYMSKLPPQWHYHFLLLINITFDPLTLYEWGVCD